MVAKILIGYSACPLTRKAFEAHGHEVWTCDLLPARGCSNYHIQGDIWDALLNRQWDMAVLHPMCTYLTVSAAWAFADPDYDKYPSVGYHQKVKPGTLTGYLRRIARDEEIENFRKLLRLPFPVAIENPAVSFINKAIRPPDQSIHPYHFGDDASKITGLWLNDLPPLEIDPKLKIQPRWVCCGKTISDIVKGCPFCKGVNKPKPRWGNQTDSGQNRLSPSENRWLERSATYPGIAKAMGDTWGKLL